VSLAAASLPHIDEHSLDIEADPEVVWVSLQRVLESTGSSLFVRTLGCIDTVASGPRPLAEGSAVPGFHVAAAERPVELALAGRHRFSDYALILRLDDLGSSRTRLRAESRAEFPGAKGAVYRMLVIGTRTHVLATRRILVAVRRDAERNG
jgi:hypothetical protein